MQKKFGKYDVIYFRHQWQYHWSIRIHSILIVVPGWHSISVFFVVFGHLWKSRSFIHLKGRIGLCFAHTVICIETLSLFGRWFIGITVACCTWLQTHPYSISMIKVNQGHYFLSKITCESRFRIWVLLAVSWNSNSKLWIEYFIWLRSDPQFVLKKNHFMVRYTSVVMNMWRIKKNVRSRSHFDGDLCLAYHWVLTVSTCGVGSSLRNRIMQGFWFFISYIWYFYFFGGSVSFERLLLVLNWFRGFYSIIFHPSSKDVLEDLKGLHIFEVLLFFCFLKFLYSNIRNLMWGFIIVEKCQLFWVF